TVDELSGQLGLALLEPTRLYTSPLLDVLADPVVAGSVHAFSHVTGGGIAANLARVLPRGAWAEVDRASWSPSPVFRVLAGLGGLDLHDVEATWNLGIGMFAVVDADAAGTVAATLAHHGIEAWQAGTVSTGARDLDGFEQGAKGVDGGAVRLIGSFAD
ncbi:MAG TPA: AIR synthase-related protein, partial [Naasia sp.]